MLNKIKGILSENFYLVGTTTFPGFHKLITLLFISFLFDKTEIGDYVNDTFIIYIFGYLTVFNWANFILMEMIKQPSNRQPLFFGKISWMSFSILVPILGIIFFLFKFKIITDFYGTAVFLFTWSFHQLWRHYFIARKCFKSLFYSDVFIMLFTLGAIYISKKVELNTLFAQSLPMVMVPAIYKLIHINSPDFYIEFRSLSKINWSIYKRALNYSLINLSTGGIQLLIAPLSYQLLNSEFTAIIGIVNNLASVGLIIPRAISYSYIPNLAKVFRSSFEKFLALIALFQKNINKSILYLILASVLVMPFCLIFNEKMPINAIILSGCVYVNLITSQLSIPWSNALIVMSKNMYLLKVNLLSFFSYICILFILYIFLNEGFYVILLASFLNIVLNYSRYKVLSRAKKWELC